MDIPKNLDGASYREVIKDYLETKTQVFDIEISDLSRSSLLTGIYFSPKDYAYKDKNGRWRAGRLAKAPKGQFIKGTSARSLRGVATKNNKKVEEAKRILKSHDLTWEQALDKAVKVQRRYNKSLKNFPDDYRYKSDLYKNARAFHEVELKES